MNEFPHPELTDHARLAAQELAPTAPESDDRRFLEVVEALEGTTRQEAAEFLAGLLADIPPEELTQRLNQLREQRFRGAEAMAETERRIKENRISEIAQEAREGRLDN